MFHVAIIVGKIAEKIARVVYNSENKPLVSNKINLIHCRFLWEKLIQQTMVQPG